MSLGQNPKYIFIKKGDSCPGGTDEAGDYCRTQCTEDGCFGYRGVSLTEDGSVNVNYSGDGSLPSLSWTPGERYYKTTVDGCQLCKGTNCGDADGACCAGDDSVRNCQRPETPSGFYDNIKYRGENCGVPCGDHQETYEPDCYYANQADGCGEVTFYDCVENVCTPKLNTGTYASLRNCVEITGCEEPSETKDYSCINGECKEVQKGQGTYTTINCDEECGSPPTPPTPSGSKDYSCINGECKEVQKGQGTYTTNNCNNACGSAPPTPPTPSSKDYGCVKGQCKYVGTGQGKYLSKSQCANDKSSECYIENGKSKKGAPVVLILSGLAGVILVVGLIIFFFLRSKKQTRTSFRYRRK